MRRILLAVLAACAAEPPAGPFVDSRVVIVSFPLEHISELDLLFVVDDSPAMGPHRDTVIANGPNFMNVLATIQGGLPDVHIGVVTTDDFDAGRLRTIDGVSFLADAIQADGSRATNFAGDLGHAFTRLIDVGSAGSLVPRPLEAIRRALTEPLNAGFRRPDAQFGIFIITANDDHSTSPIEDYARVVREQADELRLWVGGVMGPPEPFVVIGGEPRPSCELDVLETARTLHEPALHPRTALPAVRLAAFLDQFPNRSSSTTICQYDLSGGLNITTGPWNPIVGNPCLGTALADVDPNLPGPQYECIGRLEHRRSDGVVVREEVLPWCGAGTAERCFEIVRDVEACPDNPVLDPTPGPNLLVQVSPRLVRGPVGVQVIVECVAD